jgi:hypothetical protein
MLQFKKAILVTATLLSTACSQYRAASRVESASSIWKLRKVASKDLCIVQREYPDSITPRVQKEIDRRKLGDCSEPRIMCIDAGISPDSAQFENCTIQAMKLQMQFEAARKADIRRNVHESIQQMNQNIAEINRQYQQPQRQPIHTTCTPNPLTGSVDCTSW